MATVACNSCLKFFSSKSYAELHSSTETSVSDSLKHIIVTFPEIGSNPYGKLSKQALVNKLKGSLPGEYGNDLDWHDLSPKQRSFRSIFFPLYSLFKYEGNISPVTFEGDISGVTGLDDNWWSNFSVVVLCQSIYWQTKNTRNHVTIGTVNGDVDSFNKSLRSKAVTWYTHVLAKEFPLSPNQAELDAYISVITGEPWISYHQKQLVDGTWKNPEWELFHHWVKLSALGASDAKISDTMDKMQKAGLTIPDSVSARSWRNYITPWMNPDRIDHFDVDSEARGPELAAVYYPDQRGYPANIPEGNSSEFMANGQPGSKYWHSTGGSCFTGDTLVLMADHTSKPISKIRSGDKVMSTIGSRTVAFVSKPLRLGRTLYSVNGCSFKFTETHPFVNPKYLKSTTVTATTEAYVLAINPHRLAIKIPTMAWCGCDTLNVGCILCGPGYTTKVERLDEYRSTEEEESTVMYDLILEPDETGHFEYFVGGATKFLVASEIPQLSSPTPFTLSATNAILLAVDESCAKIRQTFGHYGPLKFREEIYRFITLFTFHSRPKWNVSESDTCGKEITSLNFPSAMQDLMKIFSEGENEYDFVAGELFEVLLEKHGEELHQLIRLGYRVFPDDRKCGILALTLFDFNYSHLVQYSECTNRLDEKLTIHVTVEKHKSILQPLEEYASTVHTHHFDSIIYVDMTNHSDMQEIEVKFEFFGQNKTKLFTAVQYIPLKPQSPYCRFETTAWRHKHKEVVGTFSFDMRIISEEACEYEKEAGKNWTDGKALAYGETLGKSFGQFINDACDKMPE